MNLSEEKKKAIEIVKKFNMQNRYRDGGKINNAIDTVIEMAESVKGIKMKKIKVGDYVRTDYGEIHRVVEIVEDAQDVNYLKYENKMGDFEISIEKHSKNIIDLIEVGDFVNNCKVLEKIGKFIQVSTSDYGNSRIFDWQIKTILTKEKYENNCYKVVE